MMLARLSILAPLLLELASGTAIAQATYNPFAGEGSQAPLRDTDLKAADTTIDFGDITVGEDAPVRAIVLSNTGGTPLNVTSVDLTSPDSSLSIVKTSCSDAPLAGHAACTILLSWDPHHAGKLAANLTIGHTGTSRTLSLPIRGSSRAPQTPAGSAGGTAVPTTPTEAGILTVSKPSIDLGKATANRDRVGRSVLLFNTGDRPLTIQSIEIVGNPPDISTQGGTCASQISLSAGASCELRLLYTPQSTASVSTDIVIRHTGSGGTVTIPITATAAERTGGPPASLQGVPRRVGSTNLPAFEQDSIAPQADDAADQDQPGIQLIATSPEGAILLVNGHIYHVGRADRVVLGGTPYVVAVRDGFVQLSTKSTQLTLAIGRPPVVDQSPSRSPAKPKS